MKTMHGRIVGKMAENRIEISEADRLLELIRIGERYEVKRLHR